MYISYQKLASFTIMYAYFEKTMIKTDRLEMNQNDRRVFLFLTEKKLPVSRRPKTDHGPLL